MRYLTCIILAFFLCFPPLKAQAVNPVIYADVPDMSMIRVGDTYYMSSTTMHLSPGLPIMKSQDLINWEIVGYAYDRLAENDAINLIDGQSAYGRGSWASCLKYHEGTYYASTFSSTTGKTHVYSTEDIEKGPWRARSFTPAYHDHTMFFDDDGRVYMIYGVGDLKIVEMKEDLSGVKPGSEERVLIENASAPAGDNIMLRAEGSQLFKVNGQYYLFNICWPREGMRTVIIHRSDKLTGPWEGKVGLQDLGVAQGGLIQTPDERWYAYLFRDNGGVGRVPYLVPVRWEDGWPVLGVDNKVPEMLDLPPQKGLMPGIVASDNFNRKKESSDLPLVWQWNHNPVPDYWSVRARKGFLRLTTERLDTSFVSTRNTLTQRTIGPVCTGTTKIDVSHMRNGDFAGLSLLQKNYGLVGVKVISGKKYLVMVSTENGKAVERVRIPLAQNTVQLRINCDFRDQADTATFYYKVKGKSWRPIGTSMPMPYTLPHFMGYRFGLFNYATKESGGYVDFDYFKISDG
ncbi:glycoside hydrolase 43 family protein [Lewinella sp. W8]|uniref:glycoside hydrolase family 43 protein n=1 Tax=Lewinella sp. W8 TaxID=2528208 RepID=UPI001068B6BC|nr:glycoside hydrolase 43 family protein [Lewinella sp. W8]MTB50424.1 family 43 glycosylhydrolase [Lewinella sp. W8]